MKRRSLTTHLLIPILAVAESSGIAVMIPAGATVDYESIETVFGVADLRWNGETYFANLEDVLEASWRTDAHAYSCSAWVN